MPTLAPNVSEAPTQVGARPPLISERDRRRAAVTAGQLDPGRYLAIEDGTEVVAEGDRAAVATTIEGTHEGELLGMAPTGRRVSVTGIDLVRVADGRIVEHRGLTDTVGLLRQLGG